MAEGVRAFWDRQAADFDAEPHHGLRDGRVRRAWAKLLLPRLPGAGSSVLDVGCGTGSLSVLMAEAGHAVCGVDLSGRMLRRAAAKAKHHGVRIGLMQADAARLPLVPGSFDAVVARHVLWAFDDPTAVVAGWLRQLRPGAPLLLIEGRWSTGAGLAPPSDCLAAVSHRRPDTTLVRLKVPTCGAPPSRTSATSSTAAADRRRRSRDVRTCRWSRDSGRATAPRL